MPKAKHCNPLAARHKDCKGLVSEFTLRVIPAKGCAVKVMVFESRKAMDHFYKWTLERPKSVSPQTRALASDLSYQRLGQRHDGSLVVDEVWDPRYVGLMAFMRNHLEPDTLIHECVHIGLFFARKAGQKRFFRKGDDPLDEEIAYFTSILSCMLVKELDKRKLLPE